MSLPKRSRTEEDAVSQPSIEGGDDKSPKRQRVNGLTIEGKRQKDLPSIGATPVFVREWGSFGTQPGEFNNPTAVAISDITGNLFVTDIGNNRVQVFTPSGDFIREWDGSSRIEGDDEEEKEDPGSEKRFISPQAVSVSLGEVFVAHSGEMKFRVFSETGLQKRGFGICKGIEDNEGDDGMTAEQSSTKPIMFGDDDIEVIVHNGKVFVSDAELNSLHTLTSEGELILQLDCIQQGGGDDDQFASNFDTPGSITFSSQDELVMSDDMQVRFFDPATMKVLRSWRHRDGRLHGTLSTSRGVIAAAGDGTMLMFYNQPTCGVGEHDECAELRKGAAAMFVSEKDGQILFNWGTIGSEASEFNKPQGACFSSDGVFLYVADTGNHRIQMFRCPKPPHQ